MASQQKRRFFRVILTFALLLVGYVIYLQYQKLQSPQSPVSDTAKLTETGVAAPVFLGDKEVIALSGTVQKIETRPVTFDFAKEMYFLTATSTEYPKGVFEYNLGAANRVMTARYRKNKNIPDAVVEEERSVKDLATELQPGASFSIEIDLSDQSPEFIEWLQEQLTAISNQDKIKLEVPFTVISKLEF